MDTENTDTQAVTVSGHPVQHVEIITRCTINPLKAKGKRPFKCKIVGVRLLDESTDATVQPESLTSPEKTEDVPSQETVQSCEVSSDEDKEKLRDEIMKCMEQGGDIEGESP